MTKKQRAQVVELLRCAADCGVHGSFFGLVGMVDAAEHLEADKTIDDLAWKVRDMIPHNLLYGPDSEHYRHALLEAAARVEEGSWP